MCVCERERGGERERERKESTRSTTLAGTDPALRAFKHPDKGLAKGKNHGHFLIIHVSEREQQQPGTSVSDLLD